ncbi:hypothetical protein E1287_35305 [Actinomadura sp. KC06]|uniref:DUF3303 family protein n=1 Tax=Actinomadura sp. KC06 TaxID=2530369 RepID=UPI00104FE62E|nr:DUF3303 family protein [Actinomadura sp. KC06]TDD27098.1 hypothetical protein E1287_35305 [Actinomadura sp. KC06]
MLRAHLDVTLANKAITSGKLPEVVESLMARLNPEAAYFGPSRGGRSCTIVFDMQDSSTLPTIAEPLFQELGAKIEIQPVMNADDMRKGLAAWQQQQG